MIIFKIFFAIKGNSFQRRPNFIFYSSVMFIFETVFISEQIPENSFGAF